MSMVLCTYALFFLNTKITVCLQGSNNKKQKVLFEIWFNFMFDFLN